MKSISPGTITIGVIAVVLGLVAAYAVRRSLETEPPKPAAAVKPEEGVPMVVARVNIAKNTRLTAAHLEVKKVPADQLPEGAVQLPSLLVDRITREPIEAGERIIEDQVLGVGERPGITHKLDPGFRALPIQISAANMSATLLHVGDLVDVHLTFEDKRPQVGGLATKTLLRAVRVVAKGPVSARGGARESASANVITLAVTEEQSNKLITAQRAGTLSVTLCGDRETVGTTGPVQEHLLTQAELLNLPTAEGHAVQVWKGGAMQTLVLSPDLIREAREATAADEIRRQHRVVPVGSEGPVVQGSPANPVDFLAGERKK